MPLKCTIILNDDPKTAVAQTQCKAEKLQSLYKNFSNQLYYRKHDEV